MFVALRHDMGLLGIAEDVGCTRQAAHATLHSSAGTFVVGSWVVNYIGILNGPKDQLPIIFVTRLLGLDKLKVSSPTLGMAMKSIS